MSEADLRLLRLAGFAVAMAAALAAQWYWPHSRSGGSTRVNASLWLVNIVVTGLVCGACVCTVAQWATARNAGLLNASAAPVWLAVPVSVLVLDMVSYAWHRANHVVPFLWRWHQVHHSDARFSVSTSLRFHPGELVLSLPLRLVAVVLLGAPMLAVVVFEIVFTFANAVEHGDVDLPDGTETVLAGVFITPALHRWHHTIVVTDRDRNFGTIFSFWDRLFGTYSFNGSRTRVRTGLPGMDDVGFRDALRMPLQRKQA